jgi:hypothetical protein
LSACASWAFRRLEVLRLLHVEVALRLGLRGERQRLGEHALLIGLGAFDRRLPQRLGALDRGVALRFRGGDVGHHLDARDVGGGPCS